MGIAVLLCMSVYAGSRICGNSKTISSIQKDLRDSLYAGSETCIKCHESIYNNYLNTTHNLTSRPGAPGFIKGDLQRDRNFFLFNKFTRVVIEKKDSAVFQTVYINNEPTQQQPIDIIIGSGNKGQTYLYWKNDLLFQLPVSYYAVTREWCNSPGYPAGMPRFNRVIPARCLECHSSWANVSIEQNKEERIEKNSIVYGVDCERCHGPAAEHVLHHTTNPNDKIARYILIQKSLERQQKLDLCALCHSGIRKQVNPVFTFKTGGRLDESSLPDYHADSVRKLDVHGNQYGLLTTSKCFQATKMTCSSCHNPHEREIQKPVLFSNRCIDCHTQHQVAECTVKVPSGFALKDNCIDCHMPALASQAIFLQLNDRKSTADFVRTHRVGIYKEESNEVIKKAKKNMGKNRDPS